MLLLVIVTSCTLAQKREIIEKNYPIQSFTSVEADIVGNIIYTQSNSVYVTVEGDKELVDKLKVTENNGVLKLTYKQKETNKGKKRLTVYISSPAIEEIEMDGVGNFFLEGFVAADNLTIDFEGVGNFEAMDLQSTNIKASYEGVGNLKLGGSTEFLEVRWFASESIDINNSGIGSVTYYGNPVEKNLKNSGIGKIRARK